MSSDNLFVFGGAFNPVHLGHLHIIHNTIEAYSKKTGVDKILVVPSYIPPFKEKDAALLDFDLRYKLLELSIEDYAEIYGSKEAGLIELCDIERRFGKKMFTSVLVRDLISKKQATPPVKFIAGDDILPSLHLWNDVEYLKDNVCFCIYTRTADADKNVIHRKKEGFCIEYLKGSILDISSTQIRNSNKKEFLSKRCASYLSELNIV